MCPHDVTEIRARACSNGTIHYGRQCVACLASVPTDGRTWVAHAEVTGTPPPWVERQDDGQRSLFDDEPTR